MYPRSFKIGKVTFKEPVDTHVSYETAAWYSVVRIEPGTYEVMGYQTYPNGQVWISGINAFGICVEDYTPSLMNGNYIGEKVSHHEGKTMKAGALAGLIEMIDLDDGFELSKPRGELNQSIRLSEFDDSILSLEEQVVAALSDECKPKSWLNPDPD